MVDKETPIWEWVLVQSYGCVFAVTGRTGSGKSKLMSGYSLKARFPV